MVAGAGFGRARKGNGNSLTSLFERRSGTEWSDTCDSQARLAVVADTNLALRSKENSPSP